MKVLEDLKSMANETQIYSKIQNNKGFYQILPSKQKNSKPSTILHKIIHEET